jgi:hypothetical protein
MKRVMNIKAGKLLRVSMAASVCFFACYLLSVTAGLASSSASSTLKSYVGVKSAEDVNEVAFDGYGTLDAKLEFPPPQPSMGDEQGSVSVIIDGTQHELSADVAVYHYLSSVVTFGDLKPDDYVGYKNDPSGKIVELWILNPDNNKEKKQDSPSLESPPEPPAKTQIIKNEGGVWRN